MRSRVLTDKEKKLAIAALNTAAREARLAKAGALGDREWADLTPALRKHVDELAVRAGTLDRLASELTSYDVRLEKP